MPYIPDDDEVAQLREIAQSGEEDTEDGEWDPERDIDIWTD